MSKLLLALVEWQEEGFPLGVINLRAIDDPRLPFEDYTVGLDVYAKCQGFPGSHPAKILKIGDDRRELHNEMDLLRTTPRLCSTEEETCMPQEKSAEKQLQGKDRNKKQKVEKANKKKMEEVNPIDKKKAGKFPCPRVLGTTLINSYQLANKQIQNENKDTEEDLLPLLPLQDIDFTQLADDSDHEEDALNAELIALTDLPVQQVNAKGHNTVAQKAPRNRALEVKYAEAIKENGILKCKLSEAYKELEELKLKSQNMSKENNEDYTMPKPGKLSSDVAKRYKMVELTPGSGVYLYQHDIDHVQRVRDPSAQGTAAYGKRMAKLLMNIFFTKKDFPDCKLSPNAKGHLLLDETITSAIINFSAQKSCATKGAIRQAMAAKLSSARAKSKRVVQHVE
ncbi:uncharacterized protein LOC133177267 [Saccostrea echinata]|uniref:uncharacterized protein LOC133177267 n=1 Tax=Saccostrea echinata TaxID=191078 RepID=UPI002A7EDFEF|nr:uncharacterized protein LOC133177267 [Saccostrea echinata]